MPLHEQLKRTPFSIGSVITAGFLTCAPAGAQQVPNLDVSTPVLVAAGTAEHPLYEPHLAVDPKDPDHLLAVAIVGRNANLKWPAGLDEQRCAAFLSLDGGATWTRHDFDTSQCFDPWVVITPDGEAVVSTLGKHSAFPQQGESGLVVFHSDDGGRSWNPDPVGLGRNHDHSTMAVDASPGSRRGWIYVSSHRGIRADDGHLRYGVWLTRSRNGGKTFDDPVFFAPNNLHNLTEMPVVLSDGTLIASFTDAAYTADTGESTGVERDFERRRAWVVRSTDGGSSFSLPLFITDACGPPPGYRLSALATDTSSGPFTGRLYFACREAGGGPIIVTSSQDRGETWTAPVALHATSADPVVRERIPGLTVNRQGVVLVAWIDAPRGPGHRCEESVYAAASLDGGRSFSRGALVSKAERCPDKTAVASLTGGDYFGAVALPDGRFRLLWSEMRAGVAQLLTATVDVAGIVLPSSN